MNAPATPGPGDSGSAAGSDSEQGSGSNDEEQTPTAPVITKVQFLSEDGYIDAPSGEKRTFFSKVNRSPLQIKVIGSGLDMLPNLKVNFTFESSTKDYDLVKDAASTSSELICSCSSADGMVQIAVNKIYGTDVVVYDATSIPLVATVNVLSEDESMGTVSGSGEYAYKAWVTVTAVPASGYSFKQWSDGDTTNPRRFTARKNQTLTAEFEADVVEQQPENNHPETVHLSVTRIGDGGVVFVDELCCALPYEADYAYGTTVKLAASYNQNWYFKKWSDGSTNSVKTVELTEDTNLEIEFFFDDSDDLDDNIK